jgi:hypothetical protein
VASTWRHSLHLLAAVAVAALVTESLLIHAQLHVDSQASLLPLSSAISASAVSPAGSALWYFGKTPHIAHSPQ